MRILLVITFLIATIVSQGQTCGDTVLLEEMKTDMELVYKTNRDSAYVMNRQILKQCEAYLADCSDRTKRLSVLRYKAQALNDQVVTGYGKLALEESTAILEEALTVRAMLGDTLSMLESISNLAVMNRNAGNYPKAAEFSHKQVELARDYKNKRYETMGLNSLGLVYMANDQLDKARQTFYQAKRMGVEYDLEELLTTTYTNLGRAYLASGPHDSSLLYFNKSLHLARKLDRIRDVATSLANIGGVYANLGDYQSAVQNLREAMKVNRATKNVVSLAANYHNYGKVLYKMGKTQECIDTMETGLETFQKIGNLKWVSQTQQFLSDVYEAKGDHREALRRYKDYVEIEKQINSDRVARELTTMEKRQEYLINKAEQEAAHSAELAVAEEKQRSQRNVIYMAIAGLGLVLVFAIIIFNRLRITRRQKEIIEKKNDQINQQKIEVEHKNKEIVDSIEYAKRIQNAILPPAALLNKELAEHFVLYLPKDIVAGDFYWMEVVGEEVLFAAADCTGHGVPGAMVSVMCSNALTKAVKEAGLTDPGAILDQAVIYLEERFEKSEEVVSDGMDIGLCAVNFKTRQVRYAGANNPLWIARPSESEIIEIKANKQPVGRFDHRVPFETHTVGLEPDDRIYIFSDGFVDQFGGEKGKKFKSKPFKQLLLSYNNIPMNEQQSALEKVFREWRGTIEQIDDVCVFGVKVP